MRMEKRKFRIGELAKMLKLERFVIRFWEKEFGIKTTRSEGGQRFYNEDDYAKFILIKELLYEKGFTIVGAKKALMQGKSFEIHPGKIQASKRTTIDEPPPLETTTIQENKELSRQILQLKKQLHKLRELL